MQSISPGLVKTEFLPRLQKADDIVEAQKVYKPGQVRSSTLLLLTYNFVGKVLKNEYLKNCLRIFYKHKVNTLLECIGSYYPRASEQGNVFRLVSVYIYICVQKKIVIE